MTTDINQDIYKVMNALQESAPEAKEAFLRILAAWPRRLTREEANAVRTDTSIGARSDIIKKIQDRIFGEEPPCPTT